MLCEPRLSVVMRVRGDIQPPEFHNSAALRQRKNKISFLIDRLTSNHQNRVRPGNTPLSPSRKPTEINPRKNPHENKIPSAPRNRRPRAVCFTRVPQLDRARGLCWTADDPNVYYEYGGPTGIQVEMYVGYPTGATIFFTTNGSNPTHTQWQTGCKHLYLHREHFRSIRELHLYQGDGLEAWVITLLVRFGHRLFRSVQPCPIRGVSHRIAL